LFATPRGADALRIQFFSDMHLEFGGCELEIEPTADVIVAAGDIGLGLDGVLWLEHAPKPVIYVAGNHEYYGGDLVYTRDKIAAATDGQPVYFLNNAVVVIRGVRFLGSTLWTDFGGADPVLMKMASDYMNDYNQISYQGEVLTPERILEVHQRARKWLFSELEQHFDGPTVVVTHHAPTPWSWRGDPDSPMRHTYCNSLEPLLSAYDIDLWIHGHIHWVSDYRSEGIRVVCNPRGYTGYQVIQGFSATKTVDVGPF